MINNILGIENFESSGNNTTDVVSFVHKIFQTTDFKPLAAYIVLYLVVYVLYFNSTAIDRESSLCNTFDFAVFSSLIAFALYKYTTSPKQLEEDMIDFGKDPLSFFTTVLFVMCFYLIVFVLRIPTNENAPLSVTLFGFIGWVLIVLLLIHNVLKFLFHVDLLVEVRNLILGRKTNSHPTLSDLSGNSSQSVSTETPEVFNISNNEYTYDDSQAICKAYDSRLATYDEIESAYNNGAEWCNYGWSADQMAFFPTQKQTWENLQCNEGHKNDCGRPGVNGGHFANPNIKFGVNCFGKKPKEKKTDVSWKEAKNTVPFPQTNTDKQLEEKVKYWKDNIDKNVQVSSFNKDKWSRY